MERPEGLKDFEYRVSLNPEAHVRAGGSRLASGIITTPPIRRRRL